MKVSAYGVSVGRKQLVGVIVTSTDGLEEGIVLGNDEGIILGIMEGEDDGISWKLLDGDDKQGALGSSKYIDGGFNPSRLLNLNFRFPRIIDVEMDNIRSLPFMRSVISKVTNPILWFCPGVGFVIGILGPSFSTSFPVSRRLPHVTSVSVHEFDPILLTVTAIGSLLFAEEMNNFK